MSAKLRMWLKPRWAWAAIICFVYLSLASFFDPSPPRIEALWPWAWPWSGYIVFGSLLLALLILGCIGAYVLVYHMAGPSLTSFVDKELNERTAKAKEKFADALMNFSTAICSATAIAVLVAPLAAFIQLTTSGANPVVQLPWVLRISGMWEALLFNVGLFILFWLPFGTARWFRRRALDIYDETATLAPAGALIAPGANESPSAPVGVQTTLPSANAGGGTAGTIVGRSPHGP